ncbi:hypothetical protein PCASD_24537 [Puccinia coronata f. sp. avenae]|uniref:Uncharacterized protein n=1 Tax=Puccinia coronata f. sp. avenae TaxID=200324 RepID=A0A2N5S4L7_9BASI|nr:hypothetical protein PCASD_24537 [Puccinia coronata f. sp. avenae]
MPNTLVLRDSKLLASVALVGMGTVEVMKVYSNGGQCQILSNRDDKPKRQRKGYTSYAAKPCEASRNCQSSTKSDEHLARPSEQAAHSAGPTKAVHPNGNSKTHPYTQGSLNQFLSLLLASVPGPTKPAESIPRHQSAPHWI